MKNKIKEGEVSIVNAVTSIHQILEEIAPQGKLYCTMTSHKSKVEFAFFQHGICATFQIKKGGRA